MGRVFRWNQWNIEHIGCHEVSPEEAEYVIDHQAPPWPEKIEGDKRRVWGQTLEGRYLQVIYIFDPPGVVFVIHSRDLNDREKRQCRNRRSHTR